MMLYPEKVQESKLKRRPYVKNLMVPDEKVREQAQWNPNLTEKLVNIESLIKEKKEKANNDILASKLMLPCIRVMD